jgi:acyl-CoA thioesterase
VTRFDKDIALRRIGEAGFEGEIAPHWWVVRGPHGGYLSAMILSALMQTLDDPERPPRSFTTHFVAPPQEAPLRISVTREREGKQMSFLSARVSQGERLVALALGAFSGAWEGFEFDDAPMPETPGIEEGFKVPTTGDGIPAFLGNFDMRWTIGDAPFSGGSSAKLGGWFRLDEPRIADAPMIACLLDAWAPAVFPRTKRRVVAPTIDLTMHFRAPLPLPDAKPDDFYLGHFSSALGRDGYFEEDGLLWSPRGELIAQSRQLALALWAE